LCYMEYRNHPPPRNPGTLMPKIFLYKQLLQMECNK
jgi:hypothetical protein